MQIQSEWEVNHSQKDPHPHPYPHPRKKNTHNKALTTTNQTEKNQTNKQTTTKLTKLKQSDKEFNQLQSLINAKSHEE